MVQQIEPVSPMGRIKEDKFPELYVPMRISKSSAILIKELDDGEEFIGQ